MTNNLLLIFTRNPELGKCKTRLAKTIGDENALIVYKMLLEKTVEVTKSLPCDKAVYYSVKVRENDLTPLENLEFSCSIVFLNTKNRKPIKGLSNDFSKHSFDYIIKYEG